MTTTTITDTDTTLLAIPGDLAGIRLLGQNIEREKSVRAERAVEREWQASIARVASETQPDEGVVIEEDETDDYAAYDGSVSR